MRSASKRRTPTKARRYPDSPARSRRGSRANWRRAGCCASMTTAQPRRPRISTYCLPTAHMPTSGRAPRLGQAVGRWGFPVCECRAARRPGRRSNSPKLLSLSWATANPRSCAPGCALSISARRQAAGRGSSRAAACASPPSTTARLKVRSATIHWSLICAPTVSPICRSVPSTGWCATSSNSRRESRRSSCAGSAKAMRDVRSST